MPTKVSSQGSYRFDRTFGGLRITRSSGVKGDLSNKKVRKEFEYRDGLLTRLWEKGQKDVLQAFARGELDIQEIVTADRMGKLGGLASDLVTLKPLWKTWEETIPAMKTDRGRPISEGTRTNYGTSLRRLKGMQLPGLGENAILADLERVDWTRPYEAWDQSPAGWNHIGRALSRFLTVVLGDKFHPLRRKVMRDFPKMDEHARVPVLPKKYLRRILDMVPEKYRAPFVVLAATGMRLGELMELRKVDLDPEERSIRIRDAKTPSGVRKLYVAENIWPMVEQTVPMPISHWYLRDIWRSSVDRAFPDKEVDLRIHDLRHFCAQRLSDAGEPEASIQAQLGHAGPSQTRLYSMQAARKEMGEKMGEIMADVVERERTGPV